MLHSCIPLALGDCPSATLGTGFDGETPLRNDPGSPFERNKLYKELDTGDFARSNDFSRSGRAESD